MTTSQRERAGTLLGGRYRLVEPLPGAGRTWRAQDEIDGRELAARILRLPAGLSEAERRQARQRALREAAVVARSQHPGVAHVVDAVVEDGVPWVLSVLPTGRTLTDLVLLGGPMPPDVAALIGLQVVDALVAAGVPHGDLTPDDVVVGGNGRVVVTGFGTTPVGAAGTPEFQPPEGAGGQVADLWALGVTLHVVTEGRLPGGAPPATSALKPVLDGLLDPAPRRRPDLGAVRRMLGLVAGEPDAPVEPAAPAPHIDDPEVAAALAAFDAAVRPGPAGVPVPAPRSAAPGAVPRNTPPAREQSPVPAPRTEVAPVSEAPRPPREQARPTPEPREQARTTPEPREPARPTAEPREQARPTPAARTVVAPQAAMRRGTEARTEAPAISIAPPAPDRRRHLGAVLALVATLAVLAAILVPLLTRGGGDSQVAAPPPAAGASADPAVTTPSPDSPIPPPAGYRLYRDPAGWSIAVPAGWTVARRGTAVEFGKADRTLRVVERADPPADTYAAAQRLQPVIESATPGFDLIRIANVTFRGWPTTDLEYRADTARTHSLIRSTVPSRSQVFDISWTCLDRDWTKDKAFFDTAVATFDPGA